MNVDRTRTEEPQMEIGYDVGHRQTVDWMNELHAAPSPDQERLDDGEREDELDENDPDRARDVAYDDVDELEEHPDDYATFGDPDAVYDAYRDQRDQDR
jgi:hypothetical protein